MPPVPVTLSGLRAYCGEPTRPLDDCPICRRIPRECARSYVGNTAEVVNTVPPEAERLVVLIPKFSGRVGVIERCPVCYRLYYHHARYHFLVDTGPDRHDYRRIDVDELFRSDWFIAFRAVEAVSAPKQEPRPALQKFFAHHQFASVKTPDDLLSFGFPDEAPPIPLAGDLAAFAAIAAADPPDLSDPASYALFADRITSPYRYGMLVVAAFDEIPWRTRLTDEELLQIEDLRAASTVEPQHVEVRDGATVIRIWVVAHCKLICRVLTVLPTGEVRREDAIVGEDIPTYLGKRWGYNQTRARLEPMSD